MRIGIYHPLIRRAAEVTGLILGNQSYIINNQPLAISHRGLSAYMHCTAGDVVRERSEYSIPYPPPRQFWVVGGFIACILVLGVCHFCSASSAGIPPLRIPHSASICVMRCQWWLSVLSCPVLFVRSCRLDCMQRHSREYYVNMP